MSRAAALAALLLLWPALGPAKAASPAPREGEVFEIRATYATRSGGDDGGSSSSNGRNAYVERVVAARPGGVEVEFDLPSDTSAEDRKRVWQYPVRVLRTPDGRLELLNEEELAARIERWLAAWKIPREACGRWVFTWNAFKIECDPRSVLTLLEPMDLTLRPVAEGRLYRDPAAREPAPISLQSRTPAGTTYVVTAALDADAVRREMAEAELVVGEIMGQPVSKEAAYARFASVELEGTVTVTLETDAFGVVRRRTRLIEQRQKGRDGDVRSTRTEVVERLPMEGARAP